MKKTKKKEENKEENKENKGVGGGAVEAGGGAKPLQNNVESATVQVSLAHSATPVA